MPAVHIFLHICVTSICHTDIGNSYNTVWLIMHLFAILAWALILLFFGALLFYCLLHPVLSSASPGYHQSFIQPKNCPWLVAILCTQLRLDSVKSGTFHAVCRPGSRLDAERSKVQASELFEKMTDNTNHKFTC